MLEPFNDEYKKVVKDAIKEFLKEEMESYEKNIGKLVIRYGVTLFLLLMAHFIFGEKVYKYIADAISK